MTPFGPFGKAIWEVASMLCDSDGTKWPVTAQRIFGKVDSPEMKSNPNALLADLKKPEELKEIIEWFRNYKTAEGALLLARRERAL